MKKAAIDCMGLACPAPVIKTKEAIEAEHPQEIEIVVDNSAAKENVRRFLEKSGYRCEILEDNSRYVVRGLLQKDFTEEVSDSASDRKRLLLIIGTDRLGHGSEELAEKLMINFISTLKEMLPNLWRIVFLNSGVFLTTQNSKVINPLKELEKSGVSILVCGTCLDFYGLIDQKEVGETTNMLDIVTSMDVADKVISVT